jgi:hypothetical protein
MRIKGNSWLSICNKKNNLIIHTWKVVVRLVSGRCKAQYVHVDPCIIVQFIKKSNKMQHCTKRFIIPYLYKAQHVSGDTPPIIRSLKLQWQPLVFHTWKVVGSVVGGHCQAQYVPDNNFCYSIFV